MPFHFSATPEVRKELVGFTDGARESAQNRRDLLLDLKRRGPNEIEKHIADAGITLIKIWLEVGKEEQEARFQARITDPLRQWKLSSMDIESFQRWYDYSRARDMMLKMTDSKHAPWFIARSDDKRRARPNCIAQLEMSLSPVFGWAWGAAGDGDCDEPCGDRSHERFTRSGG
jgi:hypothetical protein